MSSSTLGTSVEQLSIQENGVHEAKLLDAKEDRYGGVIVVLEEPVEPSLFAASLKASLDQWRKQDKNGIWLHLPLKLASLVEPAVQEGFRYHHAESEYLMLVCWLSSRPDTLPANASHRVGIGAFVVNDQREVLVVQEKNGVFKGSGVWKFPTGVVDEGEDICDAAVREVKEEAGIDAEFVEVLAFRQSHKSFFQKSDLFFVCMLKPLSSDIQKQDTEIEAAKWMSVDEYVDQPFVQNHGQFKQIADICLKKIDGQYVGFSHLTTKSSSVAGFEPWKENCLEGDEMVYHKELRDCPLKVTMKLWNIRRGVEVNLRNSSPAITSTPSEDVNVPSFTDHGPPSWLETMKGRRIETELVQKLSKGLAKMKSKGQEA